MPGQLEEDVVEGRAADGHVLDADRRHVEPPDRLGDRTPPILEGHPEHAVFEPSIAVRKRPQRREGGLALRGILQPNLEAVAADLSLQVVRRSLGDQPAAVDDGDPMGQMVGLVEVLRRQEDGRAVGDERLDHVPEREAAAQVEPGRRLVEEDDGRAGHERAGEVEAPAHAAGVRLHEALARVAQIERGEELVRPRTGGAPSEVIEAAEHLEVLEPGQVLVHGGVLAREPDALT